MTLDLKNPSLLRQAALIGGEWLPAAGRAALDVHDPATGAVVGQVPDCTAAETEAAIAAASAAWPEWRARTANERSALLERWHALVLENIDDLARIMTAEQGKPYAEAQGEIRYAATFIKWFAEEGRRVGGRNVTSPERDRRIIILSEPIGVSAAITPWNFPAQTITRKCAPALAAGCPVIIKPSDLTPLSALALADLATRAGFPAGVINIVTGMPQAIGAAITASPLVRKLSFTGSTRVGSLLMKQCADTVKKLSLELGGNAPLIVFEDADLDLAVTATMASKFRNGGQTCVCANRILVQDSVYDAFAAKLGRAVAALRVAPGMEPGATIGAMINQPTVDKIRAHVDDALAKGGKILASGSGREGGNFVLPVMIGGATRDMLCAEEETFGPVAPLYRFGSEAEAIELANATPYGLASYFYTRDLSRSFRVAERLEAGMVALNTGSLGLEMAPFGGVKQSGLGREGGHEGIEEYLETKAFHIGGLELLSGDRRYSISVIPGDGIGKEVMPEGVRVLEAAASRFGFTVEQQWHDFASGDYYAAHGRMMPEDWKDRIGRPDAIFFGAVGWPDIVPDHISLWQSLLQFRREYDQYVNLRPVRLMPGVPCPLAGREPGDIDFWVVRENTEGEYSSVGGHMFAGTEREVVIQETVMTRFGIDRILRFAFELAKTRERKHVTSATKSNGIAITMPFWDQRVEDIAKGYPGVTHDKYHIDILTAQFVLNPQRFDVVVASNLFGDILSDLGPACTGTIGIAPSGNINPDRTHPSLFEPVHGSAPDIAGLGVANPVGQIWSAAMMLEHLGEAEAAAAIMQAIETVLATPAGRTADLRGTANTEACGMAIAAAIG